MLAFPFLEWKLYLGLLTRRQHEIYGNANRLNRVTDRQRWKRAWINHWVWD